MKRNFMLCLISFFMSISTNIINAQGLMKDIITTNTTIASSPTSSTAAYLIDNMDSVSSVWKAASTSTTSNPYVTITLATAQSVQGYSISIARMSSSRPTHWALLGSNDNSAYTLIDNRVVTTESWLTSYTRRTFKTTNTTAYKYYRLVDSSRTSVNDTIRYAELELFASMGFSGTVYIDANVNGLVDASETKLSGYTVYLKNLDSINNNFADSTVTGSDGTYSFGMSSLGDGYVGYAVVLKPKAGMQIRTTKTPQVGLYYPFSTPDGAYMYFVNSFSSTTTASRGGFSISQNTAYADSGSMVNFGLKAAAITQYSDAVNPNLITNENNGTFGTTDTSNGKQIALNHPNALLFNWNKRHTELFFPIIDYKFGQNYFPMDTANVIGSSGLLNSEGACVVLDFLGSAYQRGNVKNLLNNSYFGWRTTYGATTGDWNDRFLAINGSSSTDVSLSKALIFADTVALITGNNYSMGFYGKGANKWLQGSQYAVLTVINYAVVGSSGDTATSGTLTIQPTTSNATDSVNLGWQKAATNFTAKNSGAYYLYYLVVSTAQAGNDMYLDNFYLRKSSYKISGTIYNDANGLVDQTINGTVMNSIKNGKIYAYLLDTATNIVMALDTVSSTGTYLLFAPEFSRYKVTISDTLYTEGEIYSSFSTKYKIVGSLQGSNNSYGSSTTNSTSVKVYPSVNSSDITNVNFGLDSIPVSVAKAYNISQPTSGTTIVLNSTNTALPGQLTGSDKEDGTYNGTNLTSKVKVFLPNYGQLYYNSVLITTDTIIANYDAGKLSVKLTGSGYNNVTFKYAFIDSATVRSDSVNYVITWNYALPVKFSSFTAQKQGSVSLLNWITESEENNKGFFVQRSIDCKSWSDLDFVETKSVSGSSSSTLSYSYIDESPLSNNNFYRIKQIDLDGNANYSIIRLLNFGEASNIQIYPNPVVKGQPVTVIGANAKSVSLYSATGQNLSNSITKNGDVYLIQTGALSSGIYNVIIMNQNETRTITKIVVE